MPSDLSIGKLENHLHEVFASDRRAGSDYVYVEDGNTLNMLESYSDDGPEERTPILFLGEAGAGKSALLANWLEKRVQNNKRSRGGPELIFWHAVGSSRQSMSVNSFLRRLMNSLKEEFELQRQVTLDEDRLSWDLPLFLEQAAKKGKVIIVIDGLHRMVNDGAEGGMNLTWLPLSFPQNVRLIMTSSAPQNYLHLQMGHTEGEDTPRKPPIILEIERRNWQIIPIGAHSIELSTKIIHSYVKLSVTSDSEQLMSGPFLTALDDAGRARDTPGLLLYESHIESILAHNCGLKPLFLRLVLRLLRWTTGRNYSLWHLFDRWMKSDDIEDLLHAVLDTVERGYARTIDGVRECRDRTMSSGGTTAIASIYPWHPVFGTARGESNAEMEMQVDFRGSSATSAAPHLVRGKTLIIAKNTNASNSIQVGRGKNRVAANAPSASSTLGRTSTIKDGTSSSNQPNKNTIIQSLGDQQWQGSSDDADMHLEMAMLEMVKELSDAVMRARTETQEGNYIDKLLENQKEMSKSYPDLDKVTKCSAEHVSKQTYFSDDSDNEDDDNEGEDSVSTKEGDDKDDASTNSTKNDVTTRVDPAIVEEEDRVHDVDEDDGGEEHTKRHHKKHGKQQKHSNIDLLPEYLIGGGPVDGFGQLVGDALALLYVARHGLTENELWSILQKLNEEKASVMNERTVDDDARTLIAVCCGYRAQFEDMFRSADTSQSGFLSKGSIISCLRKINTQFDRADLRLVLALTGASQDDRGHIDYMDLIKKIERTERTMKHNDARERLAKDEVMAEDDMSGMDTMTGEPKHNRSVISDDQSRTDKGLPPIGPLMEEALLSFLVALGVMRSPENHVLVLPFDSESLRKVVYDRYIAPKVGSKQETANTLDDSSVLSEGHQPDVQSTVASIATDNQSGLDFWHSKLIDYFTAQPICQRRCEELLWHLKICRRWHFLKDVLADQRTFDIMFIGEMRDEYMNYWVLLTEGPLYTSDAAMRRMQNDKNNLTESKRILVDLDTAAALGMTDKEMRKAMLKSRISCFDVVEEFHRSYDAWVLQTKPDLHLQASQVERIALFLSEFSRKTQKPPTFQRLPVSEDILERDFGCALKEMEIPELTEDDDHSEESLAAHEAMRKAHIASRYLYRRWMWTQFSTIALRFMSDKARNCHDGVSDYTNTDESLINALTGEVEEKKQDAVIGDQTFMRNFIVKKSDPNKAPLFTVAPVRHNAMVKNSMTPASHLTALNNITRHFADKAKNEKELPASKYKRTIQDDKELFKSIPHAYSTKRSHNRDTKFPTVDAMLKAKESANENNELMTPQAIARLGKSQDDFGGGAVAEIRRLQQEEDLLWMNSRRSSAIPGSKKEIEYEREVDRMGRLRTLADKTHDKRRQKELDLSKLVDAFNNRLEEDEYVLAGLASGESAIVHMESRFVALKSALGQARSLAENYQTLIDFLQANPPFDERHVAALEQEVVLARTQLTDLQVFRRKLYMETDIKGGTRRTNLRNKAAQYKKLRKQQNAKRERIERSIRKVEAQIQFEDEKKAKAEMARLGLVYDGESSKELLASIDKQARKEDNKNIDMLKDAGKMFNNIVSGADKEEVKALAKKRQAKMTYESIMTRTGSLNEDDFIRRFIDGTRLTESLKSQQHLTESRVSSARTEQDELHVETMMLLGEAGGIAEQSLEMATRHFDQKMFDAEIRLGQNSRQCENATLMINEIRSGVQHIINTLQANAKLLQSLPASSPPHLEGEEDIARGLSWCEERVLAINEALVLDSAGSKQAQASSHPDPSSSTLHDRQTSLAHAVQNMLTKSPGGKLKRVKRTAPIQKKGHRNISHSLIDFSEESANIISPRGILVPNAEQRPEIYDAKVAHVEALRDNHLELLEAKSKAKRRAGHTGSVQKFLTEGLATHDTQEALRKANVLGGKPVGPSAAGYGMALGELLEQKGPELLEEKTEAELQAANAKIKVFKQVFDVPSRDELKVTSTSIARKAAKEHDESKDAVEAK